jgi:hypothetical protein
VARRRIFSLVALLRLEWVMRRLLGQPLARRDWDRMTFTDKVNYRRLRVREPAYQTFCDKLRMREYIAERLGAACLPRLVGVGVGERASDFSTMPGPYVLKANHGSGMVTFVEEGQTPSADQLRQANAWLAEDYAWRGLEWAYAGARRLLLAEEVVGRENGAPLPEYKLFAFDGKTEMIHVDTDPFGDHRRLLRRPDWRPIAGMLLYPRPHDITQARPAHLDQMVAWAAELGRGLDFVRVDLYDTGERVFVGELTPYPGGGRVRFQPGSIDAWLGAKWRGQPAPQ